MPVPPMISLLVALATPPALAQDEPVLDTLASEVDRAMAELGQQDTPPYFLALELTEVHGVDMAAEEGALQGYSPIHQRHIDVDLRVGSPQLDSTHALRSGRGERPSRQGRPVPVGDDTELLRRTAWREIDQRFATARERWAKVASDQQVLVEELPSPDLAPTEPVSSVGPMAVLELDLPAWEGTLRAASAAMADSHVIHDGAVRLTGQAETRWFVSSEGARIRHPSSRYIVQVAVNTVGEDGASLELSRLWSAHSAEGLPSREDLVAEVDALEALITALREAPEQEPYTGPAILSDRAAAVFFHEILGHRLEGHRLKRVDDAQTLRSMVGEPIMPSFLSLYDDPDTQRYAGTDLNGNYAFDSQGVPAQRVTLVQGGVLQGFLESRSPSAQGHASNGHGRRQAGYDAVTRQGNLIVEASASVTEAELRQELIELALDQGLEYALLVDSIQGGVTTTARGNPNAFSVDVLVAWRVYVDGRPDELVRGVDLIGTPLVTLSRIVRAGQAERVFNGMCGAESGMVPVAAVSPSLLISQVETQRKAKGQSTPPLLPPPGSAGTQEVQP
jgi:TldD protein